MVFTLSDINTSLIFLQFSKISPLILLAESHSTFSRSLQPAKQLLPTSVPLFNVIEVKPLPAKALAFSFFMFEKLNCFREEQPKKQSSGTSLYSQFQITWLRFSQSEKACASISFMLNGKWIFCRPLAQNPPYPIFLYLKNQIDLD